LCLHCFLVAETLLTKRAADNAHKLYLKTRNTASSASVKRAKVRIRRRQYKHYLFIIYAST
jgi:hypothetical protein